MRTLWTALLTCATLIGPACALEATFEHASTAKLGNPHDIELSADGKLAR